MECEFDGCNLSMAKLHDTALKDVKFKNCKLLGVDFSVCKTFLLALGFEDCLLNLASFHQLKLKDTIFKNCQLWEADFAEADLTGAAFDGCDLRAAMFEYTVLEKADFRTAFNYSIDPELNRIKKAKFSRQGLAGLLAKYDIEIE